MHRLSTATLLTGLGLLTPHAPAQTIGSAFVDDYALVAVGAPAGIPLNLGPLVFDQGDPSRILIGGGPAGSTSQIWTVSVTRDSEGRISGFGNDALPLAYCPNMDGGLAFVPGSGGVLLATASPSNELYLYAPGASSPSKTLSMTAVGVTPSAGTLGFVPAGYPAAGTLKVVSFAQGNWHDVTLVPDGAGLFDIGTVTPTVSIATGPEGLTYVDGRNSAFDADSVLVSAYASGRIDAYEVDSNGDPDVATRRTFIEGIASPIGGVRDPQTGDLLFSAFGGAELLLVKGFGAPEVFCAGKQNSAGCTPNIMALGSPLFGGSDNFRLCSLSHLEHSFGVLFWGTGAAATPFAGGTLCINSPAQRFPVQSTSQTQDGQVPPDPACLGILTDHISQAWMTAMGLGPGSTVFVQYVSRDPLGPAGEKLSISDALRFRIQIGD